METGEEAAMRKKLIFAIKVMSGGGAERVISILCNHFSRRGFDVTLILTHQSLKNADLRALDSSIKVLSVPDSAPKTPIRQALYDFGIRILHKLSPKTTEHEDVYRIRRYKARNYGQIKWLKKFLRENAPASLVAFLYDSIFLTLLSANKNDRVIISERGDPMQSAESKTDFAFFRQMFPKADGIVFQSPSVKEWYRKQLGLEGTLIFNPIKDNLPEPFQGERNKKIVNFCRVSPQKNLILLIDAFEKLHLDHPDYELWIYGDVAPAEKEYAEKVYRHASKSAAKDAIHFEPARSDIHDVILDSAMFVSSSDFEGMSNSMLEAMAIGLPVVCTDCPAGGARAVIRDHENGLLVPVGDAERLYLAMKELIEDGALARALADHALIIREEQSCMRIIEKWEEMF